jgi:hypothetical protein
MTADPFSVHMEAVARKVLGEPNARLSSAKELRFGSHGSLSVDLEKGVWSDHEAATGGGVLDLLAREQGVRGAEALAWLTREVGAEFEDRGRGAKPEEPRARIVATYDYQDEAGALLYQVCRFEPKDFRQRRPDGSGWKWSIKGVRQVPYRLGEVIEAASQGHVVFICEGEKDCDALAKQGLTASCNAMGAGKWPDGLAEHFRGADVVILPDNDDAGRNHAAIVGAALQGHALRVRLLDLPGLPPKGDVSDWLRAGGSGPALYALAETKGKPWAPARPASRFGAISWSEIDKATIRQDFMIEDLMFSGDIGMIYGPSGSGKSFLAVHMGLSIARGVDFLGKATRKGSVIYQAGEGGRGVLKRLKAYRQENRVYDEDVPFVLLPARVDLFSDDGDTDAFMEECMAWKASLPEPLSAIFIDTFACASPGANENASEDVSRLIRAGEAINKATGAALFWVHHKNAAGDRERGHTSLRASIDTALEVTKDEDSSVRTLRLAKMKDGEDGLKLAFELHQVEIGTFDDGKPMTSCVVVPAQVGSGQTSKRRRLPPGQANFLKVLEEAIHRKGSIVPPSWGAPPSTSGIEWAAFRDLYKIICGQGREDGAIRTAMSRDGDSLWRDGAIGRHDHWLWITPKGELLL